MIYHTWKLYNIVPISKPNKDTDKGTSYGPISLLSVIAKTLEKSLSLYIIENIPNTHMQHGYKTQHSTVTALHTLNNTVAKGFNQMALPARIITGALDMSKAFDTINMHTLIRKLLQTNIPGTIIKFIVNYIKGREAYTIETTHPHMFYCHVSSMGRALAFRADGPGSIPGPAWQDIYSVLLTRMSI